MKSIISLFVFNKIKNILKKNNITLEGYFFIDFTNKKIFVDNQQLEVKKETWNNLMNEIYTQNLEIKEVKEVFITKKYIKIKFTNGKIIDV